MADPTHEIEIPEGHVMFTFFVKDGDPELQYMDLQRQAFQNFMDVDSIDDAGAARAISWFMAWAQQQLWKDQPGMWGSEDLA